MVEAKTEWAHRLCALVKSCVREGPKAFHFVPLVRINLQRAEPLVLVRDFAWQVSRKLKAPRDLISKKA